MVRLERPECPNPQALRNRNYKHPDNKRALKESSNDKCMYCESEISHIDFAHIEHIKPKAIFPDLEFEWDNLGYACPRCNNSKSDKFEEETPYLDPYSEDPSEALFAAGAFLFPRLGSERAELTISDIQLNRVELLERRQEKIYEIEKALIACHRTDSEQLRNLAIEELQKQGENDKEYSMVIKSFLNSHGS